MDFKILLKAIAGMFLSLLLLGLVYRVGEIFPEHSSIFYVLSWAALIAYAFFTSKEFKETDGESGAIIYENYIDLFKCLSLVGVPYILISIAGYFQQPESGKILTVGFVLIMLTHIAYQSAKLNSVKMLPFVLLTKLTMSFVWIAAVIQTLNPSGKNAQVRRKNRTVATLVLLFITPVINMLVLDEK